MHFKEFRKLYRSLGSVKKIRVLGDFIPYFSRLFYGIRPVGRVPYSLLRILGNPIEYNKT